ncbi:MAG: cell division topological specificity factor MinE [Candidatus Poribacteria bacterium]|nr:cell division topological specificity factor MinE [Candidatus Poribacteria bacterium]
MDFRSLFTRKSKSSNIATQRLQLILTQDRFEVSEDSMKKLQFELTEVLAKYFEFTMNSVKMSLKRDGDSYVLMADFPYNQSKKLR